MKTHQSLKTSILFLCVANSARSQIAEGLAKKILGNNYWVESAGSNPSGQVHSLARQVLTEVGVDSSKFYSKAIKDLDPSFLTNLDFVITLCSEESCPLMATEATRISWALPDPALPDTNLNLVKIENFRTVRDELERRLNQFGHNNNVSF